MGHLTADLGNGGGEFFGRSRNRADAGGGFLGGGGRGGRALRGDVDALMRLGFGGSGDDLLKNFEVKLGGWEEVDKTRTARLQLVPKDPELKAKFSQVDMWMDLSRGVALQQQWFFGASGDYKLAHYTDIKVNSPISDDVFRLKTTKKTVVVHLP